MNRPNWQYNSVGSDNDLAPTRRQAIIWTNDGLVCWRIYASLGLNKLRTQRAQFRPIIRDTFFVWWKISSNRSTRHSFRSILWFGPQQRNHRTSAKLIKVSSHEVSNHRQLDFCTTACQASNKNEWFALLICFEGNTPVTDGFPSWMVSYLESISMSWRHNENLINARDVLVYFCLQCLSKVSHLAEKKRCVGLLQTSYQLNEHVDLRVTKPERCCGEAVCDVRADVIVVVCKRKWQHWSSLLPHYGDIIMSAMVSQITSVSIVCSTVCSGADQRKHQSSASLAFVRGFPSQRASNAENVINR